MPSASPISNYFDSIQLDASNIRKKDMHLLADMVELFCLKNIDHEITLEEALDEQLGGNYGIGGIVESDSNSNVNSEDMEPATLNDQLSIRLQDIKSHLIARNNLFGDSYPFINSGSLIKLKIDISLKNKLYVFMLLCSHLRFIPKEDRSKFTSDFEIMAAFALKGIFPNWKLKAFGTANCAYFPRYSGTPRQKLECFAEESGLRLLINEAELQRLHTPNGDAGLDVVAWHPFADPAPHMPVFLAQIGCTDNEANMFIKQYTAHPSRWEHKLHGLTAIGCMVTPQCYRDAHNTWPCFTDINSVFIDRSRVLALLASAEGFQSSYLQMMNVLESTFI